LVFARKEVAIRVFQEYDFCASSLNTYKKPKKFNITFFWRSLKMSKRIFLFVSVLLIASMMLAGCAPKAAEVVKIAILAPLSGAVPTFGVSTRDGALLAMKQWNDKGGVLGMQLEAVVEDSQCEADPGVNAANKVIDQDKVKYIIGEVCSKSSIPISEIAQEKGVVQISPTSTNTAVTLKADGTAKDFVFRACFIDPFQGTVGAKFALDNLGAKKAFVIYDQGNDYVRGLAEAFEEAFVAGGGEIIGKESYTAQDTDFSAILAKVSETVPDVVYLPDYYNIVNLVTAQAKEKGITAPFMGGDGWDSADLDVAAAEGGYYTNHYSPEDSRPIVQEWIEAYKAEYGGVVPDALATLAYDAMNLMIAAIEKAGVNDAAKVKDALAGIEWEGVSGKITFDQFHNPIKAAVILQVKDGKIVYVATVAP
jgi:branched-chain amino acid transport system substrate-binding protein